MKTSQSQEAVSTRSVKVSQPTAGPRPIRATDSCLFFASRSDRASKQLACGVALIGGSAQKHLGDYSEVSQLFK
ncbi:unnamed protein product [Arctogadus glacialis]